MFSKNFLEERIIKDGIVKAGNVLKVDSFLNHQMDISLMEEIGREFKRRFGDKKVTKGLTIEASGIGIAAFVAKEFSVPMVFAKGHLKQLSVLFGLVVGYIVAVFMGKVDFSALENVAVVSLPQLMPYKPVFNPRAIVSVVMIFLYLLQKL